MDSTSIMSFNNDSTFQSSQTKIDSNNRSVHELALHAMRDRCLLLQRRISVLESDNMKLKLDLTKGSDGKHLKDNDVYQLQQKLAELTKQKSHLMHHIFMVTCENRNLWNKISNISTANKPQSYDELPSTKHAPLLRTNTYIQGTTKQCAVPDKFSESSLEEISLKLINSYVQEKTQLVEQYEQMVQLQEMGEDILNVDSIGFAYIDDPAVDCLQELHTQTEKLIKLKNDLMQQEQNLKIVVSRVEFMLSDDYRCSNCIANGQKNISSEHKEIETSDSLANFATPVESTNYNENYVDISPSVQKDTHSAAIEQYQELSEKICPMCGQRFSKSYEFALFQAHVENHFIGETEPDSLMNNYDQVPDSVDNII